MKLYVTHDQDGNIQAVGMPLHDKEQECGIVAEDGQTVSEIEVAGKEQDFADDEKAARKLTEVAEQFRVDVPIIRGKLVSGLVKPTK